MHADVPFPGLLVDALWGLLLSSAIAGLALARRSLTRSGALAACVVGTCIYVGTGTGGFTALCVFFVSSTLLGRVGRARKREIAKHYQKGDTRDALQVAANGGLAALLSLCAIFWPACAWASMGALCTAAGDTWATELGVLGKGAPWSLRTLRPVPSGTSGAVSALGLLATLLGGATVGATYGGTAHTSSLLSGAVVGAVAGFVGALADSLFGAFAQAAHHCDACDVACEGRTHFCGAETRRTHGLAWFDNDVVNLLATLVGAFAASLLALLFSR